MLGELGGLSPSPVMLMLVDTLYDPALFSQESFRPKHYFHFTKDRMTTIEKKGTRAESCHSRVSRPHMSM